MHKHWGIVIARVWGKVHHIQGGVEIAASLLVASDIDCAYIQSTAVNTRAQEQHQQQHTLH